MLVAARETARAFRGHGLGPALDRFAARGSTLGTSRSLTPLPLQDQEWLAGPNGPPGKRDEFAGAQAGPIEQFEQSQVAQGLGSPLAARSSAAVNMASTSCSSRIRGNGRCMAGRARRRWDRRRRKPSSCRKPKKRRSAADRRASVEAARSTQAAPVPPDRHGWRRPGRWTGPPWPRPNRCGRRQACCAKRPLPPPSCRGSDRPGARSSAVTSGRAPRRRSFGPRNPGRFGERGDRVEHVHGGHAGKSLACMPTPARTATVPP